MPTETGDFLEHTADVLAFLMECQARGVGCALGVVTGVTGGSARALGTVFAVREDGIMAGYVSHGCIDADLCVQAQAAMADGKPIEITYGDQSPYFDLRLPCGGTVNLLVDPAPDHTLCEAAFDHAQNRDQMVLSFTAKDGLASVAVEERITGWSGDIFQAWHPPQIKLVVAGVGPPLAAIARHAGAMGMPVTLLSPDSEDGARLAAQHDRTFHHLTSSSEVPAFTVDPWTAVLLVFHDHDWEAGLLMRALESKPFYIGALGSARTHLARLETLQALGVSDTDLKRITGPIGLLPSARNAQTLALSALAEIVERYREAVAQETAKPKIEAVG